MRFNKKAMKEEQAPLKRHVRNRKVILRFTEDELRIVDQFLENNKLCGRAKQLRQMILREILKHNNEALPMLFSEFEMRQ